MDIKQIFENNRNWIAKKLQSDEKYFDKLGDGQTPEFLYIGCSDSRVSAEDLMGLEPGQVFVHRNIANMVPNTDLNSMSVINYAVTSLKVNHIVVCGHYGCGGVLAAMQQADLGILNPWLRNIRDVYRLHRQELDAIEEEGQKYKRLVELNVQEQCINVIKTAEVQRANRQRNLKVYGWVFDIHNGELIDLNIDVDAIFKEITSIYKIAD
ncbi:carbonic anhydrase [Flavobacterium sp. I-SCBP12n]|uniref:Carbonic anhydrase 2 n=2 Tax=Flavobacterium TaxID=237 RepID=A0A9X2BM04_9FLAO|nr:MULTISPECIES: carbonic anhydrase [Flavobacterium]MBP4141856.1 carbonic anhydrase [Flavobacterium flabelliforme]MCK8143124.1 carbonic anhydrase [Flavobacterium pygoscelis]